MKLETQDAAVQQPIRHVPSVESDFVTLEDIVYFCLRWRWIILATSAVGMVASIAFRLATRPIYLSQTVLPFEVSSLVSFSSAPELTSEMMRALRSEGGARAFAEGFVGYLLDSDVGGDGATEESLQIARRILVARFAPAMSPGDVRLREVLTKEVSIYLQTTPAFPVESRLPPSRFFFSFHPATLEGLSISVGATEKGSAPAFVRAVVAGWSLFARVYNEQTIKRLNQGNGDSDGARLVEELISASERRLQLTISTLDSLQYRMATIQNWLRGQEKLVSVDVSKDDLGMTPIFPADSASDASDAMDYLDQKALIVRIARLREMGHLTKEKTDEVLESIAEISRKRMLAKMERSMILADILSISNAANPASSKAVLPLLVMPDSVYKSGTRLVDKYEPFWRLYIALGAVGGLFVGILLAMLINFVGRMRRQPSRAS